MHPLKKLGNKKIMKGENLGTLVIFNFIIIIILFMHFLHIGFDLMTFLFFHTFMYFCIYKKMHVENTHLKE